MKLISAPSILLLSLALGAGAGAVAAALTLSSLRDYYSAIAAAEPVNLSAERPRSTPDDYDHAISAVREKVAPAAVEIFFSSSNSNKTYESGQGQAGGFFITTDGWLITVPDGFSLAETAGAAVSFNNEVYQVQKAVSDPVTSVLFLKIDVNNVPVVSFGEPSDLQSGDFLFVAAGPEAIFPTWFFGSLFLSEESMPVETVTRRLGLTSSTYSSFVGSAVSNGSGEVVGILIESQIALPFTAVKPAIYSLLKEGEIIPLWFGATATRSYADGAFLDTITKKSPAESAGLKRGDIVLSVDSVEVSKTRPLGELLCEYRAGDTIALSFDRSGTILETELILGSR